MPGTNASGSTEIAIVDSKIVANLCNGLFQIDASPTVYIGSGKDEVLGALVEILNPYGVVVKPYGDPYEISPSLSGGMDAVITYPVPTQANAFQTGTYTVNLKMFDSTGASWVVSKTVKVCAPDKENKTRKYGSLSAKLKADCVAGKLYVIVDGVPTYNGKIAESQVLEAELEYPTSSELDPLDVTTGNFSVTLFEGVYKLTGEICATYNYGDNVFAKVKYKIKKEHNVRCLIDECCVLEALVELQGRTKTDCTDKEKEETASIIVEALSLFEILKLAANCGEDPSEYVADLEKLLGCKCTCNCAEGTPIIGTTPASDIVVEGCNVEVDTSGLTTTYTINNYEYVVEIAANGGALVAAAATIEGCTYTQLITFNIATVYSQIRTLANASDGEGDFWASVVNKSLRDIDPACLGITDEAWVALSFAGKWAALLAKMCLCCGTCDATVDEVEETAAGNDTVLSWSGVAYLYEIWLDGVLVGTILTSAWPSDPFTFTLIGANDGTKHTWLIVSKCSNGAIGQTSSSEFQRAGCPTVAPTILTEDVVDGVVTATCPFDLTSVVDGSNPDTAEWHTANNTLAGTIVSNPAASAGGAYWVFNKDSNGCYSVGLKVTILCSAEASCTAPQNLTVGQFGADNFFIQFQSAAYPPPGNSYTVKRRLASDPDVGGSYTTIGTPVWNASLNRWVIADLTVTVDNTLYIYRAISNCGSTEPYIDVAYVNVTCPSMVLYPTDTTVAYSFVPISTAVSVTVKIYDSTGTVLIHTDTYTPSFSNPTTGLFEYLTGSTTYKVRLQFIFEGGSAEVIQNCNFQTVTTDPTP